MWILYAMVHVVMEPPVSGDRRWRRLAEVRARGAKSVFHFDVQGDRRLDSRSLVVAEFKTYTACLAACCFTTLATDSSRHSIGRRVRCPAEMVGTLSVTRNGTVRKMADEGYRLHP